MTNRCSVCHKFIKAEMVHGHPLAVELKIGDVIRPAIVGRGIRSYVVVSRTTIQRYNVVTGRMYGEVLPLGYVTTKATLTLVGHSRANNCPDIRQQQRTQWSHNDWMHNG